jgi:sterol desaturase/sphingolipid hydroxylase (fatty acid hydroxylase superfamily)
MGMSYIILAIPAFFLLIGIELLAARLLERDVYRLADSVTDLSCGILQQVAEVFLKTALFAGYAWLFAGHRLFDVPESAAWAWVLCFVAQDFLYYWFHRWSHEVSAGWAAHVVHHQSEEYNLTVALRQGALQPALSWVFYLPLAVLGFPPAMFLAVSSFNTLYQFWIHTRLIGRLGPLEWVLNTPSHHRVHHARNPRYIDRNHGGTLIVWDRLFGTFAGEREQPVYGVTRPLASWNPLWANLRHWAEMWDVARRAEHPLDRVRVLWKRPGWRPADLGGTVGPTEVDPASHVRYEVPLARGVRSYVLGQFVLLNLATVAFLSTSHRLRPLTLTVGAAAIVLSLVSLGGLLDRRPWAARLEAARLVAAALVVTTL